MRTRPFLATTAVVLVAGLAAGLAPQEKPSAPPAAASSAAAQTFDVDAVHSTALFRVHHLKAGRFWGRFNGISGSFTHAEGSAGDLSLQVEIATGSVDTNSDDRDAHLRSPDFFNATEYPTMMFKSASAQKKGNGAYEVRGDLTIKDVTRPVTARVEWTGSNDGGPRFGYRGGLEATFTIKRSDFGVSYGAANGVLGDETQVTVSLEGVRR